MIRDFFEFIVSLLFPKKCVFCNGIIPQNQDICGECGAYKCIIGNNICERCGRDIEYCSCGDSALYFDRCIAPFYFMDIIRESMHVFKFRGGRHKAEVFAKFMSDSVKEKYAGIHFDYIIPVPMYLKKQIKRGYNQSVLLGGFLGKSLEIPCLNGVLVKIKDMIPQHDLKDISRFENIAGTFGIENAQLIDNKNILLVDDVLTTGSTLSECANLLKSQGAKLVYGVVFSATKAEKY